MIEKLLCFSFIFCRVMTFIRYIAVDFTFGVIDCVRYIEVLFHTFYCNFGRAEEYRSLYRGLRYKDIGVRAGGAGGLQPPPQLLGNSYFLGSKINLGKAL